MSAAFSLKALLRFFEAILGLVDNEGSDSCIVFIAYEPARGSGPAAWRRSSRGRPSSSGGKTRRKIYRRDVGSSGGDG
jgi:hypothetical protein